MARSVRLVVKTAGLVRQISHSIIGEKCAPSLIRRMSRDGLGMDKRCPSGHWAVHYLVSDAIENLCGNDLFLIAAIVALRPIKQQDRPEFTKQGRPPFRSIFTQR